jgi:subtilisin family serine protease
MPAVAHHRPDGGLKAAWFAQAPPTEIHDQMELFMLDRAAVLALTLTVLLTGTPSTAQTAGPAGAKPGPASSPIVVYTRDPARASTSTALLARAHAKGTIRVIVGLDLTMRDENTLPPAQEAAQARALHDMQTAVIRRVLPGIADERITRFESIPFMSVRVDARQLARLIADSQVVFVKESVPLRPALDESAPLIQADKLWDKRITGEGHTVVVIDTGWAGRHDMLKDNVIGRREACFSMHDPPNFFKSLCPNGRQQQIGPGAAQNCPDNVKGCSHGTFVASIAAGSRIKKGRYVYRGIASSAKLIIIQAASRDTSLLRCAKTPCAQLLNENILKGLAYVLKLANKVPSLKIAAVNLSLKNDDFVDICDQQNPDYAIAIGKLRRAGIAVIAGTGNDGLDGKIGSPACVSTAIAVGASTKNDRVWVKSNHSPLVKLLAPGYRIRAADISVGPNEFAYGSGTSFAAPHVAGAFALLRDFKPKATVDEILAALECTGKPIKRATGNDLKKPRINMLSAWRYLRRPPTGEQRWDFDGAADEDDWETLSRKWALALSSKQWVLRKFAKDMSVSWHPNCYEDVVAEAKMQRVMNAPYASQGGYSGLLLMAEIDEEGKRLSGYGFEYGSWVDDTHVRIIRITNQDVDNLNMSVLCHQAGVAININGYNRVKASYRNGRLRFFLNGTLVCEATDSTYKAGSVGLYTSHDVSNPQGTHRFRVQWAEITPLSDKSRGAVAITPAETTVHPEMYRRPTSTQSGGP